MNYPLIFPITNEYEVLVYIIKIFMLTMVRNIDMEKSKVSLTNQKTGMIEL